MSKQNGFTLIELLVTITIFGILLAIAIPNFTDWLNRKRVEGVANEFKALIQLARTETVKRNTPVYLQATRSSDTDWSLIVALDSDQSTPAFDTCTALTACDLRGMLHTNYPKIEITNISANLNPTQISPVDSLLTFNPNTITEKQSVTFQSKNYQLRTEITVTGLTSLCVPSGQPAIPGYSTCV